ncbi:hypothetical protein [Halalkalicoccus salilacus]|uniref:hypothetical protein n=1 Tax=Halalkalicoccus TaxID=332246 RepID=UPI002F9658C8
MTDDNDKQRMKDVDHTHPHDDTSAGALFARGPVVVADGGERGAGTRTSEGERGGPSGSERNAGHEAKERMKDVDHTPPHDGEGAKRVFERGEEYDEEGAVVEEE